MQYEEVVAPHVGKEWVDALDKGGDQAEAEA